MNKMFKNLIMLSVVICTISTVSFATNMTNSNGKGTVTYNETSEEKPGTKGNPYQLVMGEGLIDIYYEDSAKDTYFEFTSGKVNAGNYIVEHNADKKRIRFTLISTEDLRVTSNKGINYLQAGAVTYAPDYLESDDVKLEDEEDEKKLGISKPIYTIEAIEEFDTIAKFEGEGTEKKFRLNNTTELGNGYLASTENLIGANLATYGSSYVFSISNRAYSDVYNIMQEQLDDAEINFKRYSYENNTDVETFYGNPKSNNSIVAKTGHEALQDEYYTPIGSVEVIYCFKGTSSEIADALNEQAGVLESIVSKVFMAVGDAFVTISGIGGFGGLDGVQYEEYCVTLDSLIFNEYPYTIVDFFGDTGYTNAKAQTVIEFWFDFFKSWAIIIYIIVLIYIGIKTVLYSGTSKQKNVKEMFEGWLQGLLLLFFMPFLFKHLIVINDTLVDIIRVNSKYSIHAYYTFENMYSTLGGKEDGEDSTTTILERLKDARKSLEEKIDSLDIDKINAEYNEAIAGYEVTKEKINQFDSVAKDKLLEIEKRMQESYSALKENDFNVNQIDNSRIVYDNKVISVNAICNRIQFIIEKNTTYENFNIEFSNFKNKIAVETEGRYGWAKDNVLTNIVIIPHLESIITELDISGYYEDKKVMDEYEGKIANLEVELAKAKKELEGVNIAIEKVENNDADVLGEMRQRAGDTSRIFYVIIWLVLLFELIILLVLYYKRLFMLMILITIFPLVTIAYVYEKTKGGKAGILKNWTQEFIVNVFIQSMHAVLYVTLVETGYTVFIANNDNWLIFFIAVLALIIIEPVVKNILGLKSSTVSDLAKYGQKALMVGAAAYAVAGTVASTKKDLENIDKNGKNKEVKIENKNKIKDERRETLRQHRDNKINKDEKLTKEEREEKLRKKHEREEKKDKDLEKKRKKKERARERVRKAAKVARVAANATSAVGAVAGALADGGDVNDFMNASAIAKTITGTGGKDVELSKEAKQKEEDKIKQESKLKDVKQENTPMPRDVSYNGPGYDDYGYGSGSTVRTNIAGGTGNSSLSEESKPKINSKTQAEVAKRLRNARDIVRTNKTLDVTEEDENI